MKSGKNIFFIYLLTKLFKAMSITNFEIEAPDSEGDCWTELEFDITNENEATVSLIKYDIFFFNSKGALVHKSHGYKHECSIEPGEVESITNADRIPKLMLCDGDEITVYIQARLFESEIHELDTYQFPESESVQYYEVSIDSTKIAKNLIITMVRKEPDEDNNFDSDILLPFTNTSSNFLEDVDLKIDISDNQNEYLFDSETQEINIPVGAVGSLGLPLWGLEAEQLKGASFKLEMRVSQQLNSVNHESTAVVNF
jgi:hypothetical protein